MSDYTEYDQWAEHCREAKRTLQLAQDERRQAAPGNVRAAPAQAASCVILAVCLVAVFLVTWCVIGWFVQ